MLKYDTRALLEGKFTYYELVIAVAKRARSIVDQAELEHEVLDEKPVRLAIDELQTGRAHIEHVEPAPEESAPVKPAGMAPEAPIEFDDEEENGDSENSGEADGGAEA